MLQCNLWGYQRRVATSNSNRKNEKQQQNVFTTHSLFFECIFLSLWIHFAFVFLSVVLFCLCVFGHQIMFLSFVFCLYLFICFLFSLSISLFTLRSNAMNRLCVPFTWNKKKKNKINNNKLSVPYDDDNDKQNRRNRKQIFFFLYLN